jgi:hypothetical protein
MTRNTASVRVQLYINHYDVDWDDLTPREFEAILREIRKMWPPDMQSRVWFNVEKYKNSLIGQWETVIRVVCYRMPIPDKTELAEMPKEYISALVGRKIRIFPITEQEDDDSPRQIASFRRLEMQLVEVVYVLE